MKNITNLTIYQLNIKKELYKMSYIDYSVEIRSLNFDSKFKIESIYDGIKK